MISSLQTILDFQTCSDEHQKWSQNAIEDYQGKANDINTIVTLINNGGLSPLSGEGSPEGVIEANYTLMYIDTLVPASYFNPEFGAITGWVLLI